MGLRVPRPSREPAPGALGRQLGTDGAAGGTAGSLGVASGPQRTMRQEPGARGGDRGPEEARPSLGSQSRPQGPSPGAVTWPSAPTRGKPKETATRHAAEAHISTDKDTVRQRSPGLSCTGGRAPQ